MTISFKAMEYSNPCKENKFIKRIGDLYDNFNKKEFDKEIKIYSGYKNLNDIVYNAFNQTYTDIIDYDEEFSFFKDNGTVLLACSGGLDSVYQAFKLRERGLEVILFHVKNMNYYTNGQEYKAVAEFAKKFNFKLVVAAMKQTRNIEYRKVWKENPVKNEVFFSMMLDYMLSNNGMYFSSGDDLRLDIKDAVPDTNLSDAKQMTDAFLNGIKGNAVYIPIEKADKCERIRYLREHGAEDYYNSCVTAGRLTRYLNKLTCKKYGIKLPKWNCGGSCRKDAMHILIEHYWQNRKYPEELIEKCWDTISRGADNVFFDKSISLEKRISNLRDY